MFRQLFSRNKIESTKSEVNSGFTEQRDIEKEVKSIEKETIILTDIEIDKFVEREIQRGILNPERQEIQTEVPRFDPLFKESAKLIVENKQGSTALIQRKFSIGYNRAARIIEELELAGILGPYDEFKPRNVLVNNIQDLEILLKVSSLKEKYFYENILPNKIVFIKSRVDEHLQKIKETELENELIEKLKQQLLQEHKEKIETRKINQLKEQLRSEMRQNGLITDEFDEEARKREPIPQEIQNRVWNRDGGKCVKCGSQEKLEFDHIIPFSKGGSNTYRNLQLFCEKCNRQKNNKIG